MIRKHLTLTVALLTALTGSAGASGALSTPDTATTIVRDAPECGGKGFSKILLPASKERFGCIHTAGDAFNPYSQARAMARGSRGPAVAKVPCYGDGTTGPRIQMIYGYHDKIPNRAATVIKQIRNEMAPRMQAVINNQSDGKNLGLRFAMTKGCGAIDVKVIKFPSSVQDATDPRDPEGQIRRAITYLEAHGYARDDRKYQILWDGWNVGACGIGELRAGAPVFSLPVAPLSDGSPTIGGRTAPPSIVPSQLATSRYSMVFNHAGGKYGPTCFNTQGISTVIPQIHELFHTLGAVQLDAPHANTGHCDDAPSIMCPGGGPGYGLGINNPSCAKVLIETLDCGMDDYWNPDPKVGDYLFTHLNIAKSQFFGPQPQDNLVSSTI